MPNFSRQDDRRVDPTRLPPAVPSGPPPPPGSAPPPVPGPAPAPPARPRRRDPLWAKIAVIVGLVLVLLSTTALVGGTILNARYSGAVDKQDLLPPAKGDKEKRTELDRDKPLNLLLVGIDARPNSTEPVRGDTIIVVHIPKGHARAYLLSLPRDLLVEIPASPPQRNRPGRDRINAAFPYGAEADRGIPGGTRLLAQTITDLTGGLTFDGAAVINFEGFRAVVRALGGVTLCLDQRIVSEHMGTARDGRSFQAPHNGGRPWVYEAGCNRYGDQQALDIVRQRKSLQNGDYDRQRNQQRFLKAIMQEAKSKGLITDPRKLDAVIRAVGKSLTIDDNGVSPADWAWSLRGIDEGSIVMVRTPAHGRGEGTGYVGEELEPAGHDLFAAFREDRIEEYLATHPELINPA